MTVSRFLSKIWIFVSYLFNKQCRALMKYQPVKYDLYPLSPGMYSIHQLIHSLKPLFLILFAVSRHRLTLVQRKVLVLDLDETLIHSHHDGLPRNPSIKPGTPHDFTVSCRFFERLLKIIDAFKTSAKLSPTANLYRVKSD